MMEDLRRPDRIVGTKQVLKAIACGSLKRVYIAKDVDAFLHSRLTEACEKAKVEYVWVESMKNLGTACGIDVGAACAGIPAD